MAEDRKPEGVTDEEWDRASRISDDGNRFLLGGGLNGLTISVALGLHGMTGRSPDAAEVSAVLCKALGLYVGLHLENPEARLIPTLHEALDEAIGNGIRLREMQKGGGGTIQ